MDNSKIDTIKEWLGTGSINIFGRQYSGKDTQCEHLARNLNAATFGGGDILRKSNMPKNVMDQINSGGLSPTQEYRAVVAPYFAKKEFEDKPLILSTVGRMSGEESVIIKAAKLSNHEIKAVIVLNIEESVTWDRFVHSKKHGTREIRDDDEEDSIKKRLLLYNESTKPVINTYRSLGLVIEIDASQGVDAVYEDIINKLYERATNPSST